MSTLLVELTAHSVARFHERVRPALSPAAAEDELARLLSFARIVPEPPTWLAATARQSADAYAVVGDIVLPLVATGNDVLVAKSCIPRGGISEIARQRRNARRQRRERCR